MRYGFATHKTGLELSVGPIQTLPDTAHDYHTIERNPYTVHTWFRVFRSEEEAYLARAEVELVATANRLGTLRVGKSMVEDPMDRYLIEETLKELGIPMASACRMLGLPEDCLYRTETMHRDLSALLRLASMIRSDIEVVKRMMTPVDTKKWHKDVTHYSI